MQNLYHALWGKPQLSVIKEFTVPVPDVQYGIRPGYQIDIRQAPSTSLLSPQSESNAVKQVFRMLEVGVTLPCGVNKLLVRQEYEDMHGQLARIEAGQGSGIGYGSGATRKPLRLDYQLFGQPGIGV